MSDSIFNKSAIGSFYNISVSGITLILGFTRAVILMRLLGVESFGTISLALFFSKLILPLSSLGLDHALLQKKAPSPDAFSTHFILRIAFSAAVGLLCLGISPVLRIGYDDQLVNIFLVLLIIGLFDSTYATQYVILRREMRFGALAIINLCASVLMTLFTPIAAYSGAGVWSLVIEQALGSIVRWIGIWIFLRPWNISLQLNITEAHSQIAFGSQVVSGNLLGTVLDRFDDFWIGTTLGSTALGYYSRAYELTQYPERIISSPISSVFLSVYASVQDNRQELAKLFFRSSSFLVRAGLWVSALMVIVAPELVILLFTPKWLSIVPIFRLMAIYIILDPFYINLCSLLVGVGHPKLLNRIRLVQAGFFILTVIIFAEIWGTNGVAIAANIMMAIGVTLLIITSRRFVQFSLLRMWLWPSIAAIAACSIGFLALNEISLESIGLSILLKILIVSVIYLMILLIFEYKDIRRFGFASIKPVLEKLRLYAEK
jgi:O-antigen/teichoic acid export membrane protein